MQLLGIVFVVVVFVGFFAWARWVYRKHEEEAIYDTPSEAESHKRDPFFQAHLWDGFGGGSGGL